MAPALTPILVLMIVIGIPVVCGTLIAIVGMLKGGPRRRNRGADQEEARLMQELYQSMNRLEERIEAIETIVTDNERQKEKAR